MQTARLNSNQDIITEDAFKKINCGPIINNKYKKTLPNGWATGRRFSIKCSPVLTVFAEGSDHTPIAPGPLAPTDKWHCKKKNFSNTPGGRRIMQDVNASF